MAAKRSMSDTLGFALVGGIVATLVAMSLLAVYGGAREATRILIGEWTTTSGKVLSTFDSTRPRRGRIQVVEYEYEVKTDAYRGYHQSNSKKFAPGQHILVYYDQRRASVSYAEVHPREKLTEAIFLAALGLLLLVPSGAAGLLMLCPAALVGLLASIAGLLDSNSARRSKISDLAL